MSVWSFFARDPTKDFAYEIGDSVLGLEEKSIWKLHKGKKKTSGEPVSVFIFEAKPGLEAFMDVAKASVKRLKTMRHPNILTYVDSLEVDKLIYLVTEYVEPLETHLSNSTCTEEQKKLAISWGLYQIARGLGFLTNDCNLVHHNVCMASVFVDRAGEWRLGGVDYMCAASESPPLKTLVSLEKYNPPERSDSSHKTGSHKWAGDSWGLGCLVWESFNGPLPRPASLKSVGKIPQCLIAHYSELVSTNSETRPSPVEFLKKSSSGSGFLNNKFIDTLLFLEEIQIKDTNEKSKFFNGLTSQLDTFPQDICKFKILPQLLNAFEFGNAGSAVLSPLFKLGKLLDEAEYQQKIVPCVVKLFSSKDRATRAKLLQQMDHFIHHLQSSVINDQIFPNVVQGFLDTNPSIREHTVKCMLHLAPKLNYHNLNEEMLRHFARLQVRDEQGGIRTNTTVCLGKLASYLHPQIRQKVLIPAFTRAMRDPFPPARIAAILALSATQSFFTLKDCATKVLPALCHLTVDLEKSVRDQSFKAASGFLSKLEKVSEDPSLTEQMEADVNAASASSPSTVAASWAGWAVSSLTAKFYRSSIQNPSKPPTTSTTNNGKIASEKTNVAVSNLTKQEELSDNEEKWHEPEWSSLEDISTEDSSQTEQHTGLSKSSKDEWDDGGWESFDIVDDEGPNSSNLSANLGQVKKEWNTDTNEGGFITTDSSFKPASAYNWGNQSGDEFLSNFISSSGKPSKKESLVLTTPVVSSEGKQNKFSPQSPGNLNEGWDISNESWNEWDQDTEISSRSKAEEARRKRDERRQQRQKDLHQRQANRQASRPMKLGAQRIA